MSGRRRRRGADGGPRPLGDSLSPALARLAGRGPAPPAALFSRWDEIAGPALAASTRPVRLVDGELVVAVDSPPRATAVRAGAAGLLERARRITGARVTRLSVTVGRA